MERRPVLDAGGLAACQDVVRAGLRASPDLGFMHPGDLSWWWGYGLAGVDLARCWHLWLDGGRPAGWVLLDEARRAADMAVLPAHRGGPLEAHLVASAEEGLGPGPVTLYAWRGDQSRETVLRNAGYHPGKPFLQTFRRDLHRPVAAPHPPDGFRLLPDLDEAWVPERAECHHRAFDPSRMTEERYRRFRTTPGYDPELDVAVAAADGRIAAFCMAWVDATSGQSLFEPVGTRPHLWRRGLGAVVNQEALRRVRSRGMHTATVNTWAQDRRNVAFYESLGFRRATVVTCWSRVVPAR